MVSVWPSLCLHRKTVNNILRYCCANTLNFSTTPPSTRMASSALLAQIQAGRSLKKTVTNDRSAPAIDGSSKGPAGGRGLAAPPIVPSSSGSSASAGPPQLGGLFAGGIPKLKPAQSSPGMLINVFIVKKYNRHWY